MNSYTIFRMKNTGPVECSYPSKKNKSGVDLTSTTLNTCTLIKDKLH